MKPYIFNLETTKIELHFEKSEYTALSAEQKANLKSAFLWSRAGGCWVSRAKEPNLWWAKQVAAKLGFTEEQQEGERLSFSEQVERQADRPRDGPSVTNSTQRTQSAGAQPCSSPLTGCTAILRSLPSRLLLVMLEVRHLHVGGKRCSLSMRKALRNIARANISKTEQRQSGQQQMGQNIGMSPTLTVGSRSAGRRSGPGRRISSTTRKF